MFRHDFLAYYAVIYGMESRELRKQNEKHLCRIQLFCKEALQFINQAENELLSSSKANSLLLQFLEDKKSEIDDLYRRYILFVEECNYDNIQIKNETIEHVKTAIEKAKESVKRLVTTYNKRADYVFGATPQLYEYPL